MERKIIEAEILRRRQQIKHLHQYLSRAECGGKTYSSEEDIKIMEEIEQLEDEIADLEKQLADLEKK